MSMNKLLFRSLILWLRDTCPLNKLKEDSPTSILKCVQENPTSPACALTRSYSGNDVCI